jgi:hypothetical protein
VRVRANIPIGVELLIVEEILSKSIIQTDGMNKEFTFVALFPSLSAGNNFNGFILHTDRWHSSIESLSFYLRKVVDRIEEIAIDGSNQDSLSLVRRDSSVGRASD